MDFDIYKILAGGGFDSPRIVYNKEFMKFAEMMNKLAKAVDIDKNGHLIIKDKNGKLKLDLNKFIIDSEAKPQPTPEPTPEPEPEPETCPLDEIWYTTTTGEVIPLISMVTEGWGANIISNTYENGKGIIKFDNDVLYCPTKAIPQRGLKTLILPDNMLYIGNDAFMNNGGLISVKLPNNTTELKAGCFKGCTSLLKINIPDKVKTIGNWAFFNCPCLTDVIIGESVHTIGYQAFCTCNNLSSITIKSTTVPNIDRTLISVRTGSSTYTTKYYTNALNAGYKQYDEEFEHISVNTLCPIYVPSESLQNYKNSEWNKYWTRQTETTGFSYSVRNILPIE